MGNLKNNIDHYMKVKGIKMYSHLLVDIAHELGIMRINYPLKRKMYRSIRDSDITHI